MKDIIVKKLSDILTKAGHDFRFENGFVFVDKMQINPLPLTDDSVKSLYEQNDKMEKDEFIEQTALALYMIVIERLGGKIPFYADNPN